MIYMIFGLIGAIVMFSNGKKMILTNEMSFSLNCHDAEMKKDGIAAAIMALDRCIC